MTLQSSDRIIDLHQVSILAFARYMEGDGSVQFWTVKKEAQGFGGFFLDQALLDLPDKMNGFVTADHPRTLGSNLHAFEFGSIVLSTFNPDH
mgnify:CR=1 FL=1